MKRVLIIGVGALLGTVLTVALLAQEPARFNRGIDMLRGNFFIGQGDLIFEGATANNFETTFRVTDPTADRIITWPDSTGTVALSGGSAPFLDDDAIFALGTNTDQAQLNRSTILAADTALTDVLIGTPISEAIAANTLMIANQTSNGDISMYINDGGTSTQFLHMDGDVGILELAGYTGGTMLALEINPPAPDLAGEMVHIWDGTAGSITCETNVRLCLETDDTTANYVGFLGSAGVQGLTFGDAADANIGIIEYDHATNHIDITTSTVQHTSFNQVGIQTQRLYVREDFDQGTFIHQDDMTAKSLTDNENNIVLGAAGGWIYGFREELTKTASSWVVADGTLDISADNTIDNEGVEIVVGFDGTTTTDGVLVAGTNGACFRVKFTITLIAGTDQFLIGWRDTSAYQDSNDFRAYTIWNAVGITNVDGSIFSEQEVSEATDTDDSGTNAADADVRVFESCISAGGVPTAGFSGDNDEVIAQITLTNTGSTLTAGTQLAPFITYMQAGGATDAAITIDWWEVTGL